MDPDKYCTLTACSPYEIAKHIRVDGKKYGALSYFLTLALQSRDGGGFRHIYYHLLNLFQNSPLTQNPSWHGNLNQGFFGIIFEGDSRILWPVTPAAGTRAEAEEESFHVDGGTAHGLRDGDALDVFTENGSVIRGRVIEISGLTSKIRLEGTMGNLADARNSTTLSATPHSQTAFCEYPTTVSTDQLSNNEVVYWDRLTERHPWLRIQDHSSHDNAGFRVSRPSSGFGYNVLDATGCVIDTIQNGDQVLAFVEHITKWTFARNLRNPVGDAIPEALYKVILLSQASPSKTFLPGETVEVKSNDRIRIKVSTFGDEQCVLYFHIYRLGQKWEVQNMMAGKYQALKGKTGTWFKYKMTVPEGDEDTCEDIFKVFITDRDTSFHTWELAKFGANWPAPETGEHLRGDASTPSTLRTRDGEERWTVLDFKVKVSK